MGIHFYDECPHSIKGQILRLRPAAALTRANIPCLIWAEDALCFAHFVPTALFALQLVVPDDKIEAAAEAIVSARPFQRMSAPPERWLEWKILDPSRPSCFPTSLHLRSTTPDEAREHDDPGDIYLHPQSTFHIDISDDARSTTLASTLPLEFSALRFPTRTAFLDALIDTYYDPPGALRVYNFARDLTLVYLSYILLYTLRTDPPVLPNGELKAEYAAVRDSLRPENRLLFERHCGKLQDTESSSWYDNMLARRQFMQAQGTPNLRPLPLDVKLSMARRETGNPKLRIGDFTTKGLDRRPLPSMMRSARTLATLAYRMI
ncbi:hypothetical protein C8R47DRAFT_1089102 [Mycena vitilis]|nr:hypothetical protein C8R47DRAFT_1089102 [Mycena vitilis]